MTKKDNKSLPVRKRKKPALGIGQGKRTDEAEKLAKVNLILEAYIYNRDEKGSPLTIQSCCAAYNLPYRTFMGWCSQLAEIAQLYKQADALRSQYYKDELKADARNSLKKLINGYQFDEVTQEGAFVKDGSTGQMKFVPNGVFKRVTKYNGPSTTAVMFALKNADADNFSDTQRHEITGKGGGPIQIVRADLANMSVEQLFFIKHGRLPEEGEL